MGSLLILSIIRKKIGIYSWPCFLDSTNYSSKLCRWATSNRRTDSSGKQTGGASDNSKDVSKLDNYQNFSKAFNVAYQPLMASLQANKARLKGAKEFKPHELTGGDLGGTLLSELLMAIQELLNDKDPKVVLGQIRTSLDATYFQKHSHLMAIAHYLADMWRERRPEEAQKAEIVGDRIRNEGI